MDPKTLAIVIILFCIIPTASALSPPSCDAFSVALTGDPAITAVSGNGNVIAIGGTGGIIGTFTPGGSTRWVYRIPEPVTGIAVSEDGRFVAATTFQGDLYFFNDAGFLLWNNSGFGCNSHVALSGNGQEGYVVSRSPTQDLTGDTVFHFAGNGTGISRLPVPAITSHDLSTDGRMVVVNSGGSHGNNYLVAIDNAGIRWEKMSPRQWRVPYVAVSDDGNTVAAAEPGVLTVFSGWGRTLWNTTTNYITRAVAVSGDGQYIAVGTQYRVLYFNRSGILVWEYPVPDYIGHVKTSKDGTMIVATTRHTLYYLDGNGTCLWQYPLQDWTESLSMSGEGDRITVGTYNNTFSIFDGKGNVTEIDLDTIPVIPVIPLVTAEPESPTNSTVLPARSLPASGDPFLTAIAFGLIGLLWRGRKES